MARHTHQQHPHESMARQHGGPSACWPLHGPPAIPSPTESRITRDGNARRSTAPPTAEGGERTVALVLDFNATEGRLDAVLAERDLVNNPAAGGLFHVAGPDEGGWRIVDVWESPETFETFLRERLGPLLEQRSVP